MPITSRPIGRREDYRYETVVSVDLAALGLFPDNAERFKNRVDLAIDHHPSYEGFGRESCVHPECAACGEILYELAVELGQLTPAVALPLYVAVSTDTGCFVYSNVTANTHRVAAALMETGYRLPRGEQAPTSAPKRRSGLHWRRSCCVRWSFTTRGAWSSSRCR